MTGSSVTPLSLDEVLALLGTLGELGERVVLIGGQAISFWADHYVRLGRAPEISTDAPLTSKDIDFCGPRDVVPLFARRLRGGRARLATLDDATPNVGVIRYLDDAGYERVIDFLGAPFGMTAAGVQRDAVPVALRTREGVATGHHVLVMHPLACLESRVHNVVGLAHAYDTPHGRRQLRAAVVCAREALKDVIATPAAERFDPVRTALDLNERLFHLCHANAHGRVVLQRTGIDPFDAVLVDPRLGEKFFERRLPQMRERLARLRGKLSGPGR